MMGTDTFFVVMEVTDLVVVLPFGIRLHGNLPPNVVGAMLVYASEEAARDASPNEKIMRLVPTNTKGATDAQARPDLLLP